jgi:hypothetical protein
VWAQVDVAEVLHQTPTLLRRLYEGLPEGPHDPKSNKMRGAQRELTKNSLTYACIPESSNREFSLFAKPNDLYVWAQVDAAGLLQQTPTLLRS